MVKESQDLTAVSNAAVMITPPQNITKKNGTILPVRISYQYEFHRKMR